MKNKILKGIIIAISTSTLGTFFVFSLGMCIIIAGIEGSGSAKASSEVTISEIGEKEIPQQYIEIYRRAAEKYDIENVWLVLPAIHRVETNFSKDVNISIAGAIGHMQFMPQTWVGWSYPDNDIPQEDLTNPEIINRYGGYGQDGDGDGKADPNNIDDAIYSAAYYLSKHGAKDNLEQAIFEYNHANWYVDRVMNYFKLYSEGFVEIDNNGNVISNDNSAIEKAIEAGSRWIGKSPYVWGGGRNPSDIAAGRFDCSSFIHYCYSNAGISLGDYTGVTTFTLINLGKKISPSDMKRGDIIFFDTYTINGHVGIYLGDNLFLHDSSTYGVTISRLDSDYYKKAFNGNVRRVVE